MNVAASISKDTLFTCYEQPLLSQYSTMRVATPLPVLIFKRRPRAVLSFKKGNGKAVFTFSKEYVTGGAALGSWTFSHSDVVLVNTDSSHVWPSSSKVLLCIVPIKKLF